VPTFDSSIQRYLVGTAHPTIKNFYNVRVYSFTLCPLPYAVFSHFRIAASHFEPRTPQQRRIAARLSAILPMGAGKLHLVQFKVLAPPFEQLFVQSFLDYPAINNDQDAMGVSDGR